MIQINGDKDIYDINLSVLKKLCACGDTSNQKIKTHLEKLPSVVMKYNYLNKDNNEVWECLSLLPWINIEFGTGVITYNLSDELKKNILYPNIYAPINIIIASSLKSKYSIILYELLRDYIDAPQVPLLSIKKFKDLMGIKDDQYNDFKNLKRLVLNVAVKEINEKTDIKCSCDYIKHLSKRYTYIKFQAVRKNELPKIIKEIEQFTKEITELTSQADIFQQIDNLTPEDLCKKISMNFKIRTEMISILVKNYGIKRLREVYKYTLKKDAENPAGFFLKALEDEYKIPSEDNSDIQKIKTFKSESANCFNKTKGYCGSTWKTAFAEKEYKACYYCSKYKEEREDLSKDPDSED
jgi:hypothetical protein